MTHAELITALHRDPGNHDVLRALAMLASQAGDCEAADALTDARIAAQRIRYERQYIARTRAMAEKRISDSESEIRLQRYRCPHPIREGNLCLCCGHEE